jgi:hypothetical protein
MDAIDAELPFSLFISLIKLCVKDAESAVPAVVCHVEAASTSGPELFSTVLEEA